jgi:hypothetical protein
MDGAPRPTRRSFETRLLFILAGIFMAGLLGISLIRLHEETVSFNLSSGDLRLDRYLCGFQYASEPVEAYLGWLATLEPTPRPARWMVLSERHDGSLLRRPHYQRRIGQVYLDACVMAQANHSRDLPRLRQTVRAICAADSERIWALRQGLREEFERRRQVLRPVDRRPTAGNTPAWPPATR